MCRVSSAARTAKWLFALYLVIIAGAALATGARAGAPLAVADRAWRDNRATEAWTWYRRLDKEAPLPPAARLRLAGLALERGACGQAALWTAEVLIAKPSVHDAARAHLIRGQCATQRDDPARAAAEWSAVKAPILYVALAAALRGEAALQRGDHALAAKQFEAASHIPLPAPWDVFVRLRLAQLSDDAAARDLIAAIPAILPPSDPHTRPLLPLRPHAIAQQAANLRAALAAPASQQAQLRGQHLLDAGLPQLAAAHFARMAQADPGDARAAAYAAYARYQLGEYGEATNALDALAVRVPDDPLVAALRATLALERGDVAAATAIIERAEREHAADPAIALLRADMLAAERHYSDAFDAYRRARDLAPAAQRARYAVVLAQRHLDLAYRLCDDGMAAAQVATTLAPDDASAWQAQAAIAYHCRRWTDAAAAAQHGLEHDPNNAALMFYRGAALWEQGDHTARSILLHAADLDPASVWRERAEEVLHSAR